MVLKKKEVKKDPLIEALPPAIVHTTDMDEETQQKIIPAIQQGLIKSTIEKDIAQAIKLSVDSLLGGSWQCIVGKDFTCSVTYETKEMLLVSFGKLNILLFKSYE